MADKTTLFALFAVLVIMGANFLKSQVDKPEDAKLFGRLKAYLASARSGYQKLAAAIQQKKQAGER